MFISSGAFQHFVIETQPISIIRTTRSQHGESQGE